jgi:single-strand DNA-binding protein
VNEIQITVQGNVVTEPVERQGRNGKLFLTFRVGTTPRRRNADGTYVDGYTSYFSVIAFDALAANASAVLKKGQPVVIQGTLAQKEYVDQNGVTRSGGEITARHLGHDLAWGRGPFQRVSRAAALGLDPTADPEVEADLRALIEGVPPEDLPPFVDADGVVSDDYDPEVDDQPIGDPETDDYEVVDRMPA